MSPLPFLPGARDEVPAERFVVFADQDNAINVIDETRKLDADDQAIQGVWESPSMSRADPRLMWSIQTLTLFYTAEGDTTVILEFSRDGGDTWEDHQEHSIKGGLEGVEHINAHSNLVGNDVRFRILLESGTLVKILGYRASLRRHGPSHLGTE